MTAEHRRIFIPKVYDDPGKTGSLVYLESTLRQPESRGFEIERG